MNEVMSLDKISRKDVSLVGGKAASLGELKTLGLPVPDGFVVTSEAFRQTLNNKLPLEVQKKIIEAFDSLNSLYVAVRSSAIAEDSIRSSWAGQLETYLNTVKDQLMVRIIDCRNSIKSQRARVYASEKVKDNNLEIAVFVQQMIDSDISGVIFTANPVTNNDREIVIEAVYGLGEKLVQGQITPYTFFIEKTSLEIRKTNFDFEPILTDEQLKGLSRFALRIETYFGMPQDIEWAYKDDVCYILQSRPITTLQS